MRAELFPGSLDISPWQISAGHRGVWILSELVLPDASTRRGLCERALVSGTVLQGRLAGGGGAGRMRVGGGAVVGHAQKRAQAHPAATPLET